VLWEWRESLREGGGYSMGWKGPIVAGSPRPEVAENKQMSEGMEQIDHLMVQVARLFQEGRYEQALPVAQQACELPRRLAGAQHPFFAISLNNLAMLYKAMGDPAAALPVYRQALEVNRAALGEAYPIFATSLHNLAALYRETGDPRSALPLARQALEVYRATLGEALRASVQPEPFGTVAPGLVNRALEEIRAQERLAFGTSYLRAIPKGPLGNGRVGPAGIPLQRRLPHPARRTPENSSEPPPLAE
jgi:tetratricopeptide (TPR) repeat protein